MSGRYYNFSQTRAPCSACRATPAARAQAVQIGRQPPPWAPWAVPPGQLQSWRDSFHAGPRAGAAHVFEVCHSLAAVFIMVCSWLASRAVVCGAALVLLATGKLMAD